MKQLCVLMLLVAIDSGVAALLGFSAKTVRRAHLTNERERKCPECSWLSP
jgi:hypothetical protein